jgi:phage shock protein PspC (stress-responsive transcriptional regulator)
MNKVLNINLGGLPFVIDDTAYDYLSNYLSAIRNHFSFSESRDEIMYDIEMRMAELFQEKLRSKQIITMMELDSVIKVMGKPEDFGGEPLEDVASDFRERRSQSHAEYKYMKPGKRLFRDEDNKVVAGVCSGLSSYLGIDDPIWIRLAFFLSMMAGFGVIAYFFFWIAVPKATTSSDRLSMKGEPINIENIAKKVEEEIDAISKSINEFGEDISRRSKENDWTWSGKSKKKDTYRSERF